MAISDDVLKLLLREIQTFVRRLPVNDSIRDDIISNATLLISERTFQFEEVELEVALRWARGVTFFAARSIQRTEFRRTAAWERLRDVFDHEHANTRFTGLSDDQQLEILITTLSTLGNMDRQLLIGQVWDGHSCQELAEQHQISVNAVSVRLSRARVTCRQGAEKLFSENFAD